MLTDKEWAFEPSSDPDIAARLTLLKRKRGFESIALEIAREASIRETRRNECKGYWRPVFTISVRPALVDQFHSGPDGYRARYFQSISEGEAANRSIIKLLLPKLTVAWSLRKRNGQFNTDWLNISLRSDQAKIWIHQGKWLRRQPIKLSLVNVARWDFRNCSDQAKLARWAKLLPFEESKLTIKGAYVSRDKNELPNPSKSSFERARMIHTSGFT